MRRMLNESNSSGRAGRTAPVASMDKMYRKSRRGFTLIEMLTVIGVILFMMAFIIGVFLKYQQQGKVRACQALIQKIGIGLAQYQAELRSLPPDTGFNQPASGSCATFTDTLGDGLVHIKYDTGSLWRYLGQPLKQYQAGSPRTFWRTVGPYLNLTDSELEAYSDPVNGASFRVVDPWRTTLAYIGDPKRVIHNRDSFDLFSCGADKVTAETNGLAYWITGTNNAYNGSDDDGDGYIDNATEMGVGQLNGTLTGARRLKSGRFAPANEVLDDINNWDPQY